MDYNKKAPASLQELIEESRAHDKEQHDCKNFKILQKNERFFVPHALLYCIIFEPESCGELEGDFGIRAAVGGALFLFIALLLPQFFLCFH